MKKVCLLFLALGVAVSVNAQKRASFKPEQKMVKPSQKVMNEANGNQTIAPNQVMKKISKPTNNKSKDITYTQIGSSGNCYGFFAGSTASNSSRAFLTTNPDLGILNFVHRSKTGVNGATSSGFCQIDYSLDGGVNWTSNDSLWNASNAWAGWDMRYPQAIIYNPAGNNDPNNAFVTSLFPFNHATFGTCDTLGWASKAFNNQYLHKQIWGLKDAGGSNWGGSDNLTIKNNGEIINIDAAWELTLTGNDVDSLAILKGVFNSTNHNWDLTQTIIPIRLTFEGQVPPGQTAGFDHWAAAIKVDFSANDQIGYCGFISHNDSGFQVFEKGDMNPVYIKTTDGGATWSETMNIGKKYRTMNAVKYFMSDAAIVDSFALVSTVDSVEYARTNLLQFSALQMENSLAIDANDNPHFFVRLMYSDNDGNYQAKWCSGLFEIYSNDGGVNWDARLIGQVNYYYGAYDDVHERNRLYITKSPDRTKLFFTWLDADLGSTNENASPNIFVRGIDVNTGAMTDTMNVTRGTNAEASAHWGTPSYNYCFADASGYNLPFVHSTFSTTGTNPVDFYAITDFIIGNADFVAPVQATFDNSVANQLTLGDTITQPFGGNKVWATYNTMSKGDTTVLVQAGTVLTGLMGGMQTIKLHNDKGFYSTYNVDVVGINELNNNNVANFTAYPNPAKDQLNVNFNIEGAQNVTVKLVSVNGQVAYAETFNANGNVNKTIDVSNYAQGIYFVQVVTANGVATQKVAIR